MHQTRCRNADRPPGQPLKPGASREMLAFDRLRLLFSDCVMVWCEVTTRHAGMIRITPCDTQWLSIGFHLSKDLIFMDTPDIGPDHTPGLINGMPSPALRRFLPDQTPHLLPLSSFNLMNCHCCFS